MSTIDDRVVNMQFNNDQFQKGISQTNHSLEDLKNNLHLDGATNGIDQVQSAANRFSLSNMESALDNISSKFGVFGAVGFTIIQNLTNSALDAGKNIAAGLIDPIVQGGAKRALALQQAKFQFQGLGLDIDSTMAAALAAVKGTAFGLDDAATAAAQFGASGINAGNGLETVLRSVAGVAAQTGSSYANVANIFETIAGNGRIMGEQLNQLSSYGVNAAAVLAKSLGTTEQNVRSMVTDGKISFQQFSDAMNSAFGANAARANETYTGALDNMHAALARIGADVASPYFLGMRDIFNTLGPIFDNIHAALMPLINDFASFQSDTSAATVKNLQNLFGSGLLSAINNIVDAIKRIGIAISGGFHEIFPDDTTAQLSAVARFINTITEALIPGGVAMDELKRSFAGFFAVFDILGQIVGSVIRTIGELIGVTAPVGGSFLEITARVGDFLVKVDEVIKKGQFFQNFFKALGAIIAVPISILKTFFGIIADGVNDLDLFSGASSGIDDFATDLQTRFSGLIEVGHFFQSVWQGVVDIAKAVWGFLQPIFVSIGNFIGQVANNIKQVFKGLTFDQGIQLINTGIFGGLSFALTGLFGNLGNILKGNGLAFVQDFNRITRSLKVIFNSLTINLKAFAINTNAKTLKEIAISVALLAASAVALSLVDGDKLAIALSAMTAMVAGLLKAFKVFSGVQGTKGILQALALSVVLQGIAGAILILTGSIAILGALPFGNLIQGVIALVAVLGALVGALALLNKLGPDVLASAAAIAILAPGIAVLAGAVAILGAIPFVNLAIGLGAFVVMLAALVGALALLNKLGPEVLLGAVAIALIAPALAILTGAVAALGAIPFLNLLQGVGGLVVILAALAGAILLLGLAGPEALLGAVAISAVALSLVPLVAAIALLGRISFNNLIQGMVAFGAALAILVGAVLLLGFTGPVALIGAAAIVAIALAIAVLAPALKLLSTIPWDGIGKVLTILSAGLGILVVMGILLIPASVGFLLLGAAILLIGTGIGLAANGVGLLAVGIAALVVVGAGGIALFSSAIDQFIQKLPALGAGIGAAIVSMAVVIGADAPQLITAFVQILLSMLAAIDQVVPQIIVTATDIIVALVNALVILVPLLVDAGLTIINGVLQGISDHIEETAELGVNIVANFINGVAKGLPNLIQSGVNLVLSFMNGVADSIRNNRQKFVDAALNIADAITGGLSTGLLNGVGKVVSAVRSLISHIPQAIKDILGIRSPSKVAIELLEYVGDGASIGLANKTDQVTASAAEVGNAAISGLKNSLAGVGDALNDEMDFTPTIRPVLDISDIQNKSKQIPAMLQAPSLSLGTSNDVAQSVSLQEQAKNAQIVVNNEGGPQNEKGDIYFTQNNNSPKALSTTEIYRQTNNQLSKLKGDLGVVDQSGS